MTVYDLKSVYGVWTDLYGLFFQISEVYLNNSSAMGTLNKLFGLQAEPVELELLLTMGA